MKNSIDTNRINYISFAQVVATISVLMIHTNGCFWKFTGIEKYWVSANIIECLCYFGVPVFFMITGATLINYRERYSTFEFFKRRFMKTVIPFVAWNIIAVVLGLISGNYDFRDINLLFLWNGMMKSKFIGIYWFFITLFCIYLAIPLLSAVDKERRKAVFSYLAIGSFFCNALIPFIIKIFKLDFLWVFPFSIVSGHFIWPIIGVLLTENDIRKDLRYLIYGLAIIGLLMHICGTYRISMTAGKIIQTYKGYNNVPCILYSVGVFILLKKIGKRAMEENLTKRLILVISKYTMSIYLLQPFVFKVVNRIDCIDTTSLAYRVGAPFIMLPVIIFITYVIRKMPIIKCLVP